MDATATTFRTVIGLEVHAQILTSSKMYCRCSASYADAAPNTHVCAVCLGLPGALPVMNRLAVETVVQTGLALNCEIASDSKMDRKNYVYPDLPKGYQISQYDLPLCGHGALTFDVAGESHTAGITRVHLEEDTGRLVHDQASDGESSLVDLNRSGVPLMEIVGDPDLQSPEEAREYLTALRQILRYIGASSGNMEEGAFRCDANISIRATDDSFIGPKVEIKNMNSFRAVERALRYEEVRQREAAANGEDLFQETRGWIDASGTTVSQRTKEQAHDYRYFPEPDLPSLRMKPADLDRLRQALPELPASRRRRFIDDLGLPESDAAVLTNERAIADVYEDVIAGKDAGFARSAANWIVNDVLGLARSGGLPQDQLPLNAAQLRNLVESVEDGKLTVRVAKDVLPQVEGQELPLRVAERLNLLSMDDDDSVTKAAQEAIDANPDAVADYLGGKKAAVGRLIGETMKRTGGRAKPDAVRGALIAILDELEA
ncbi:MAG: Asp-tRNA(Asn)/Glu-tRNA(Gln) amidotransferase subunit GatB [Chloroflexota bacterium]|nr:Asp-tRNA(Asn)/Glu-tRNA(Gln) amidotransferase subunit GatB [Chloroflexota bacterium]